MHACIAQKCTTAECCGENMILLLLHLKQEHKLLGVGVRGVEKLLNNLSDKGQEISCMSPHC